MAEDARIAATGSSGMVFDSLMARHWYEQYLDIVIIFIINDDVDDALGTRGSRMLSEIIYFLSLWMLQRMGC